MAQPGNEDFAYVSNSGSGYYRSYQFRELWILEERIPMNLKKVDRLTPDKIVKEQWETLMKSYGVMNNHNEL